MTLLAIAEVLSGEALVSPGGPIDRDTAVADDIHLFAADHVAPPHAGDPEQLELVTEPAAEKVLVPA